MDQVITVVSIPNFLFQLITFCWVGLNIETSQIISQKYPQMESKCAKNLAEGSPMMGDLIRKVLRCFEIWKGPHCWSTEYIGHMFGCWNEPSNGNKMRKNLDGGSPMIGDQVGKVLWGFEIWSKPRRFVDFLAGAQYCWQPLCCHLFLKFYDVYYYYFLFLSLRGRRWIGRGDGWYKVFYRDLWILQ